MPTTASSATTSTTILSWSAAPGEDHNFLPGLLSADAHASLSGVRQSPDDRIAKYARATIEQLNRGHRLIDDEMAEEEPLVEVEALGDDDLRGRELEVSLREDIGHEHSRVVGRRVKALKQVDGWNVRITISDYGQDDDTHIVQIVVNRYGH